MRDGSRAALAARRPWMAGASVAAVAWSLAGTAAAQTAPAPAGGDQDARTQALEAEVRELTAEVRDLATEVRALKAQTTAGAPQGPPPSPAQTAQAGPAPGPPQGAPPGQTAPPSPSASPRAGQYAPGQYAPGQYAQGQYAQGQYPQGQYPYPQAQARATAPTQAQAPAGLPRVGQFAATPRLILGNYPAGLWMALTANVQFDTGAYFGFHPDNPFVGPQALSNGSNARRARFGVVGGTPGGWSFAFVYDAGNSQDTTPRGIETAQVVYGGMIPGSAVELGYSDTYFTLDQATRSRDLLFLERSSATNIATDFNAGDFRANTGARFFTNRYWAGAYLTGPAAGDSHTETAERFGAFERGTVQALQGDQYSLHLGVDFDQLIQAPNNGVGTPNSLTLSDQPELRIDPTVFLNTGAMGTTAHPTTGGFVYDLETAATYRGLMWQGEYHRYLVNRAGLPNADFSGWYGQVAWTFTGETHAYNEQAGSYFRIIPFHPFDLATHQWGAWEIAARLDYVDLDSHFIPGVALSADPAAVEGGTQRGLTIGLNWYPNDIIRFLLDYIHIDYDKENGTNVTGAPLGVPVGAEFNAIALRSQFAF